MKTQNSIWVTLDIGRSNPRAVVRMTLLTLPDQSGMSKTNIKLPSNSLKLNENFEKSKKAAEGARRIRKTEKVINN